MSKRYLSCQNTTNRCQKSSEKRTYRNSLKHMRSFMKRRHQECLSTPFPLISSVVENCPLIVKSYLQNQSCDCEILRERTKRKQFFSHKNNWNVCEVNRRKKWNRKPPANWKQKVLWKQNERVWFHNDFVSWTHRTERAKQLKLREFIKQRNGTNFVGMCLFFHSENISILTYQLIFGEFMLCCLGVMLTVCLFLAFTSYIYHTYTLWRVT